MQLYAKGRNGAIKIDGDRMTIERRGLGAWMGGHGTRADKLIMIPNITSVQFKRPGMMVGYLQVAYPGSQESKGAFAVGAATYDENTVTFSVGAHRDFLCMSICLTGLRPRRRTPLRRHAAPGTIHWNG